MNNAGFFQQTAQQDSIPFMAPLTQACSPLIQLESKWAVKMDCLMAGHSHKARAADYIVKKGVAEGLIVPNKTILIEKTGGNFGLGLVLAAKKYNLGVELAIGLSFSQKKREYLCRHGASLIGVEMLKGGLQPKDVIAYHLEHQDELKKHYFYTDQFNNVGSLEAHEYITGPELVKQLRVQYANVNTVYFVSCAGTGAHITGIALALKKAGYVVQVVLVEPHNCNTLNNEHSAHIFEGMNVGVFPPFLQASLIDDVFGVKPEDAQWMQQELAIAHGYYLGLTSAACLYAARHFKNKLRTSQNTMVVSLAYDLGFWYGN